MEVPNAASRWKRILLPSSMALLLILLRCTLHSGGRKVPQDKETVLLRDDQLAIQLFPSETTGPSIKMTSKELVKNKTAHKRLSIDLVIVPFLKYSEASSEIIIKREQEYRTVMQRNLNHPLVNRLHVLTTDPQETMRCFNNFTNQEKMIVAKVKRAWMRDPFEYISLHLVGKDAMYANADIYLGDGFDLVDPEVMSNQNIMYSLTRQVSYNKDNCTNKKSDFCRERVYEGSHDTFLFRLRKPLTEDFLENLEYDLGSPGMENVLMWAFETKLNYCILNPCRILETFHLHCSELRSPKKIRVNIGIKSKSSPPTRKLACSKL